MRQFIPGTSIPYNGGGMFSVFRPMIQATDGLSLRQVCSITGLEPSTIQNWIKRGFVMHPVEKKYRERHLARILLISALRDCMKIDSIGELLVVVNGDADDTGDDIISEEQLYDYLCEIIGTADERALSLEEIPKTVRLVTKDYVPTDNTASGRLNEALTVMVFAFTAGQYKKEADKRFSQLKEKHLSTEENK